MENSNYSRKSRAARTPSSGSRARPSGNVNGNRKLQVKENMMRLSFAATALTLFEAKASPDGTVYRERTKQIRAHYARKKLLDKIRAVTFAEDDQGAIISVELTEPEEIQTWGWVQTETINEATGRPWMGWRIVGREDLDGNVLEDEIETDQPQAAK